MKRKLFGLYIISLLVIVSIVFIAVKINMNSLRNTTVVFELDNIKIIDLDPVDTVELPNVLSDGYALTVTGLSYNVKDNIFYIGNYGKAVKDDKNFHPSIVTTSSNFSTIENILYFENKELDMQGIVYDEINESLWYTNGDAVINCKAADGEEFSQFFLDNYSKYKANGICIDVEDGSLWVLCLYKYLLHYSRDGVLLNTINCSYVGQDHICMNEKGQLYISVGVDYKGENNFVIELDRNGNIQTVYRVKKSYAIEGIVIINDKLYVANDGIYHDATILNNYIQIYNIP